MLRRIGLLTLFALSYTVTAAAPSSSSIGSDLQILLHNDVYGVLQDDVEHIQS